MSAFRFPPSILASHVAILGKTGSGKTSTGKLLVEQVVDEHAARVCVLDTVKSDWWGLTSSADGKRPGLPFHILGGPRGHVALHSGAGKAIAEIVANGTLPLSIIDMVDFEPGGTQRFFIDFAPALIRHMRGVLYLVIEEAHELAPKERAGMPGENMAVHYAKKLATAGRSKGVRMIVLSQRTQALHNAVLGSCETLVAHRFTTPADQKPIVEWLRANAEKSIADNVSQQLSGLRTGSAWIVSGEAQIYQAVSFPRIKTFDNSATPNAEDHEHHVTTAPVDTEKLRAIVGTAVKEAEENDPKMLRAKIAKLETIINKKLAENPLVVDQKATTEAQARGYEQGWSEGWSVGFSQARGRAVAALEQLEIPSAPRPTESPVSAVQNRTAPASSVAQPAYREEQQERNRRAARALDAVATGLPPGELRILTAIAQEREPVTREQLTVLTGYKRSSRDTYIFRLRERGFVKHDALTVWATPEGIKALGPKFERLPTGAALRKYWVDRLRGGEGMILNLLLNAHPKALSRDQLSELSGYKRSSRDTYIYRLGLRNLVTTDQEGVRASDVLFA